MEISNVKYKEQLYPAKKEANIISIYNEIISELENGNHNIVSSSETLKETSWSYKGIVSEFVPSIFDTYKFYMLLNSMTNNINELEASKAFFSSKEDSYKDLIRNIIMSNKELTIENIKVDIIKGSIYKIKKYFLENNKIKDIRGGSTIIDYLNNDIVPIVLEKISKEKNTILSENNIVYTGGGNILIITPQGLGEEVCKSLEKEFTEISLTVMNAFEYLETTIFDISFNYKEISSIINKKLEERKKIKLYKLNPQGNNLELDLKNITKIDFRDYPVNEKLKKNGVVCELCNIRDAYHIIRETNTIATCPSCLRKHIVGKEKSIFYKEYERYTGIKMDTSYNLKTINDISDEIAVVYGDGNNMGKIVMDLQNVFEMMYFSRKTDKATKTSVYESIKEVMNEKAKFEVIALGGDDIFIIVPAKEALKLTERIIDKFDNMFDKKITMSVGIAIASSNTPIATMFTVAQDKLKSAKKYLKQNPEVEEGSVDLVKIIGSANVEYDDHNTKLFPMSNTMLKRTKKELKNYIKNNGSKAQIHKISYAQQTMMEQEFELFFLYNQCKNENKLKTLVKKIYDDNTKEILANDRIWDDLLIVWDLI